MAGEFHEVPHENLKLWNVGDTRSVKVFSASIKINFIKSLQFVSEQ